MRLSPPPAPRMKLGSLSRGSYRRTAGMLVMKVAIHSRPVMRASLRSDISAGRSDAEDAFGEDTDMPTPLGTQGWTPCGRRGARSSRRAGPLDRPAGFRGEAQADRTVLEQRVQLRRRPRRSGGF